MESLIYRLQDQVADRLRRLNRAPVVARRPRQTESDLDAELAQVALGFFVFPPLLRQIRPNSTGLFAEEIEIRVSCFEQPSVNNTPLTAYHLVELGLYQLHHWQPALDLVGMLYAREQPVADTSAGELTVFDLTFVTSGGYEPRPTHL